MAEPDDYGAETEEPTPQKMGAAMAKQLPDATLKTLVAMCADPKKFAAFEAETEALSAQLPAPLLSAKEQCANYNAESASRKEDKKTGR